MPPRKPNITRIRNKEQTKTIPLKVSGKKASKTKDKKNTTGTWVKQWVDFLQNERLHFVLGIVILIVSVYFLIGMISYFFTGADDLSKMELGLKQLFQERGGIKNITSVIGALFAHRIIDQGFGIGAFAIPFFTIILSLRLMKKKIFSLWKTFLHASFWLVWLSLSLGLIDIYMDSPLFFRLGGSHGVGVANWLISFIGNLGILLGLGGLLLIYAVITSATTIPYLSKIFSSKKRNKSDTVIDLEDEEDGSTVAVGTEIIPEDWVAQAETGNKEAETDSDTGKKSTDSDVAFEIEQPVDAEGSTPVDINNVFGKQDENEDPFYNLEKLGKYDPTLDLSRYQPPTLDLLKIYGTDNQTPIDMKEQTANKERITTTLRNYGIDIKSIKATVGPTITLYEIVPKEGIRISKIRNLEYDIMLSLAATGIRIIAPIPGKGTIGIEVPNAEPHIVSIHSIIASKKFQDSKFDLPIAFGKTITNEIFMVDLTKMPHLLVAGATGQGKSVGLHAIITSLLYKKHPSVLKLVLIDPKKVEFNVYNSIEKQFLAKLPDGEDAIITDTKEVIKTLKSLTAEMDERYELLKKAHARNIKEYNEKFINRRLNPTKGHKFLPYIVVVIDEFGDLIMTAGKEIELPIARIAQLARAIGIHIIIATQRPSVNIITGVIKANFPARVAFRVSSMIDSRTIIDGSGANQLIGRGDMLFTSGNELIRVQCAFVDTPEVENIVNYISAQPGYPHTFALPECVDEDGEGLAPGAVDLSKRDPMFEDAARLIVSTQQGSTSNIQRKFSIGYNRAGRIVDQLEVAGIIGPSEGSKPRQVLVMDEYQLEQILRQL